MSIDGVIIVLGSRNDEKGNLTPNARERAEKAIQVFRNNRNYKLLSTGGYGTHFNTTDKPHSWHIKQYLLSKGIMDTDILPLVESKNTIEDAKLSKSIVDSLGIKKIVLVTSDFHMMRAWIIFKKVFGKGYVLKVVGTKNTHTLKVKIQRYYHEARQTLKILLGIIKI